MINEKKVFGLLGLATRAGKVSFGAEMCEEQINKNKIKFVVIASNASERTKKRFIELCNKKNIKFIEFGKIEDLSKAIGKENKAIIGIKDINFKNAILKIIDGGELIG